MHLPCPTLLFRSAVVVPLVLAALSATAGDSLRVQIEHSGTRIMVGAENTGTLAAPTELRLQRTSDLTLWTNAGPKLRLPAGATPPSVLTEADSASQEFFRLSFREAEFTAKEGADVLGYSGLLADQLDAIGAPSPEDFAGKFPPPTDYRQGVSWDVTQALYWTEFQDPDPIAHKPDPFTPTVIHLPPLTLTPSELSRITSLGFVATDRFQAPSFADVYYDIFRRDLPVLVTTDSILHAWHRSVDGILEDLELKALQPALREILRDMAAAVPAAESAYGAGPLADSVRDADYFLTVARRLLDPQAESPSALGQEDRIAATLEAIHQQEGQPFTFFDSPPGQLQEWVDFSQYKPRGHYTKKFNYSPDFSEEALETLTNYFQAMMWLGRVDLRIAGNTNYATPRQMGTAVVLHDLLQRADAVGRWRQIDQTLNVVVGPADSLNFDQLGGLLTASGRTDPASITSPDLLTELQASLESGKLGTQAIQGHSFWGSAGDDQIRLPRSFTFLGQRFTMDNWALGQVTFDRLVNPGSHPPTLIRRRRPYSLDVAFTVFGNNQVVPDLLANMANPLGQPFRDGFPYQHALYALRTTLDQIPSATWENNLYNRWLLALRSLSAPTTGPEFPEAMRTHAWAMKTLNTQLASWTQLRHDTVLYTKPAEAPPGVCYYPYSYVEPLPDFYRRMRELSELADQQLQSLAAAATITNRTHPFLSRFGATCSVLESIATKELRQETLASSETNFLGDLIEHVWTYDGDRQFNGWYPRMYYRGTEGRLGPLEPTGLGLARPQDHDSALPDFIVTDVFTDGFFPADSDPGGVLHEGIGPVNYLFLAADTGPDKVLYAGPTLSHFEFWQPYGSRLTDETWTEQVKTRKTPPVPPWVLSYTVPAP